VICLSEDETRFQWSFQKSINVDGIPFLIDELYEENGEPDLDELEEDFNLRFDIIKSAGVADNQRPFARTIYFIKEDLKILNDDYTLKEGLLERCDEKEIYSLIYEKAYENYIPFRMMIDIFRTSDKKKYGWDEFKSILSNEMVVKAKTDFPKNLKEKRNRVDGSIYRWEIDDPSLNRLVELGRLLGICSFQVKNHVRFVSEFDIAEKKTVDFEELIDLIKRYRPGLDHTDIISIDEIYDIGEKESIPTGVIEDAILSEKKRKYEFFSGKSKGEENHIDVNGKKKFSIRFKEEAFI